MAATPAQPGRERRRAKPSRLVIEAAVLAVGNVAFATLCPIDLRPHLASADVERFCAFLALGILVARAAPRRPLMTTAAVVLLAVGLEAAQRLVPGRHAAVSDAAIKALGAVVGVAAFQLHFPLRRWLARPKTPLLPPKRARARVKTRR